MQPSFAALLLAGGRSHRMGVDKAFLDLASLHLWQYQLQTLASLSPSHLFISIRSEQWCRFDESAKWLQQVGAFNVTWLHDPPDDQTGPMGAILRALIEARSPLIVLAVDMPGMTSTFLQEAFGSLQTGFQKSVFFNQSGNYEPLAALYSPTMIPLIERHLEMRQLSLQRLISEAIAQGLALTQEVLPELAHCFCNLNSPEDWRMMRQS